MTLRPFLLLWTLTALSCGPTSYECLDAGDCAAGEGEIQACIGNRCEEVDCLASQDCPIGEFCDTADDHDCVAGCEDNGDCLAGDYCNDDGECVPYGCRSTILDCDWGQICDVETQQCVEPSAAHCLACDSADNDFDGNNTVGVCDDTFVGAPSCGGEGTICASYPDGSHCAIGCEDNGDCPAGFACVLLSFDLSQAGCPEPSLIAGSFCISSTCTP